MPKKPTVARTPEELQLLYKDLLKMLVKRCDAFYEGDHFEARGIASILRMLLRDYGRSSRSVLGQLGIKNKHRYLDSRMHNNLAVASSKGAWPRMPFPYGYYTDKSMHSFDDWWQNQEFQIVYKDIIFTRKDLVLTIAQEEAGDHVSPEVDKRIAALNRIKSPWQSTITDNDDGTQSHILMFGSGGNDAQSIYEFELASVCAIGEELLFSLTPEPENRKRIQVELYQKPFYLSMEESDAYKDVIRCDLAKLDAFLDGEVSAIREAYISSAIRNLNAALEIECLTAKDCEVTRGVAYLMKLAELPWAECTVS